MDNFIRQLDGATGRNSSYQLLIDFGCVFLFSSIHSELMLQIRLKWIFEISFQVWASGCVLVAPVSVSPAHICIDITFWILNHRRKTSNRKCWQQFIALPAFTSHPHSQLQFAIAVDARISSFHFAFQFSFWLVLIFFCYIHSLATWSQRKHSVYSNMSCGCFQSCQIADAAPTATSDSQSKHVSGK